MMTTMIYIFLDEKSELTVNYNSETFVIRSCGNELALSVDTL